MTARNVLFIMCDQLRWDYLSCAGHPFLKTPNIDWLASRGVQVQPRLCPVTRLRRVAHELLHGPLRQLSRRVLERLPAQGGGADDGRLPAPAGPAYGACRQDPHGARRGGHGAAGDRSAIGHRRACVRMRIRALRARRRAVGRGARRALRRARTRVQSLPQPEGVWRLQSVARLGQFRAGREAGWRRAGRCAMRASPPACARRIPRRRT